MGKQLFKVAEDHGTKSPLIQLLNEVIRMLPRDKQIEKITTVLEDNWQQNEAAIPLVEALELAFENPVALREHLRQVYDALPKPEGYLKIRNEEADTALKLRLAILKKILYGWISGQCGDPAEDAEVCFEFVCRVYSKYAFGDKMQKGIRELFYLEGSCLLSVDRFDKWICRNDVPRDILEKLLKARARILGIEGQTEIKFLDKFNIQERSAMAIAIVEELMQKIRQTEELVSALVKQIKTDEKLGFFRSGLIFSSRGEVEFEFICPENALVKIEFFDPAGFLEEVNFLDIVNKIKKARDELLKTIKLDPPAIRIEATGLNFSYKE